MRSAICNQSWVSIWEFFCDTRSFCLFGNLCQGDPERTNERVTQLLYVYSPAGYAIKEEENGADEYRQAAQGGE